MSDVDTTTHSLEDMSMTCNSSDTLGKPNLQTDPKDDQLVFPEPPEDWQFNKFIGELADNIGMRDLEKLKLQFSGADGISSSVLDSIKDVRTLFTLLKTKKYLNRENMVYLQVILQVAGRIDLVEKVIEFSREMGNTLFFYPATAEPENGYKYVKMHVQGKDFSNCTSQYIEDLRNRLSRVLFVPNQYVVIAGIEPSSSLLITFMVPAKYVELMERRLIGGDTYPELHVLGIDIIQIGEKAFNLTGLTDTTLVATEHQEKLSSVYKQLQTARENLERSDLEVVRMSNDINRIRNEQNQNMLAAKAIVRTFEDMLKKLEKDHSRQIDMQELQNRVQEFEESLKTVTEINNNKQLVENIVNQHSELVTSWMSVWFTEREQSMQSKLRSQALEMIAMGVQLTKYKFLASIEFEQLEKDLLEMIQSLPAKLKEGEQFIEINETVLAILRKISRGLRHKEKLKLLKKYVWEDDDPLKADMDRDQSYFLAGIIYKEIQTNHKLIPVDQFISDLLLDVGRDDLRRTYCRLMKTSFPVRPQTPTYSPPVTSTENPQMLAVVTKMAGEVSEIHQRMTSIVGNFNTGEEIPLFGSKNFQTRESSSDRSQFGSKYFQARDPSTDRGRTQRQSNSFETVSKKCRVE